MQKARRHNSRCSDRLWADGFRVSFTPLFGVLFTFPSRYWFAIGLPGVFSLTGWSPLIHARFLVPRATQDATRPSGGSRVRGCHPLRPAVLPLSLATTRGITVVFFSCGYLDVSVPHVRLPIRGYQSETGGLPHSETRGSRAICASPRLIAAYRVLRRLREPRHPPSALSHFLASPTGFPGRRHICLVTRMISLPCSQHVNDLSPTCVG